MLIHLPPSFLPDEDRSVFMVQVQLPVGSTQQQTLKVVEKVENYFMLQKKDNVLSVFSTVGSGPGGNGQNVARLFIRLKKTGVIAIAPISHRFPLSNAPLKRLTKAFNKITEAKVLANNPAAISGLGNTAGFDLMLDDHSCIGHQAIMAARDRLLSAATGSPLLTRVRHNSLDDSPQLLIDIDQRKVQTLGVSVADINNTLQTAQVSSYINDFLDREWIKRVYVQAAAKYRMLPQDIYRWYVRNSSGSLVPFLVFASSRWEYGAPRLERYNGYASLEIGGEAAPGVSRGAAMEKLVRQLSGVLGLEWTTMSYQERLSGVQAPALYVLSLLMVFFCLAALYESWSIPFSVILVVPMVATWFRSLENDVYFQVGLITVIGLLAKNAITSLLNSPNELHMHGMAWH